MATLKAAARTTDARGFGGVPRSLDLPNWAWVTILLALGLLYSVTFDTGALSSHVASSSMYLHELFHDGRHLLGVPCH